MKKINHSKVIKSIIKNTNFTNEELARYLGISLRTAQNWTSSKELRIASKYWPLLIKIDKKLTGRDLHGCGIIEEPPVDEAPGWLNEEVNKKYIEDNFNENGK